MKILKYRYLRKVIRREEKIVPLATKFPRIKIKVKPKKKMLKKILIQINNKGKKKIIKFRMKSNSWSKKIMLV